MNVLSAYGEECRPILDDLLVRFRARSNDVAIFLVYDRPERALVRPDLDRTYFVERCLSDQQIDAIVSSLRTEGCYVELFPSEVAFAKALAAGRLQESAKPVHLAYNGTEGGVGGMTGFGPGRKAMVPALCDAFGVACANSSAYTCAIGRHKYHYTQVLRAHGLPVPEMWHYEHARGWVLGMQPPNGSKVIAKSTFESWSVGVTENSVFVVDKTLNDRVREIAECIGQSVCVQIFQPGAELCAPVMTFPQQIAPPIVGTLLKRQPNDPEAVMTIDDNLTEGGVYHFRYEASYDTCRQAAELAAKCCRALGISGLGRVDMRLQEDGKIHAFDVGVSPGITAKGSSAAAFKSLGYSYDEFVCIVFAASLAQHGFI